MTRTQPVFPFVVGCGRSGTTLLRAILDSNPLLAIPPESFFIEELASSHGGQRFTPAEFVKAVIAHPKVALWNLDPEVIREAVLHDPPSDYAEAVRRVFAAYATAQGKPRYGDKTPWYVVSLPLLSSLFPEARFVHIVRDGRDVAPSLVTTEWGKDNLRRAARSWQNQVHRGRAAGKELGPSRYLEVSYERLVADPESVVQQLCEFADVPYVVEMLHPEARFGQVMVGEPHPEQHTGLQQPITPGLRDWRNDLTARDVALIEAVAGDTIRSSGYQLSRDGRVRARARWLRLRYAASIVGHRFARSVRRRGLR